MIAAMACGLALWGCGDSGGSTETGTETSGDGDGDATGDGDGDPSGDGDGDASGDGDGDASGDGDGDASGDGDGDTSGDGDGDGDGDASGDGDGDAGVCGLTPIDDACSSCAKEMCCEGLEACFGDPECACVLTCVAMGNDAAACHMQCNLPEPNQTFGMYITCVQQNCGEVCG